MCKIAYFFYVVVELNLPCTLLICNTFLLVVCPHLLCKLSIPIVHPCSQFCQRAAGVEVCCFLLQKPCCLHFLSPLACFLNSGLRGVSWLAYYCPFEKIQTNY